MTTGLTKAIAHHKAAAAQRITEIKARVDAASPGPWAGCFESYDGDVFECDFDLSEDETLSNIELIIDAPNDLKFLLDRNAALEAQIKAALSEVSHSAIHRMGLEARSLAMDVANALGEERGGKI